MRLTTRAKRIPIIAPVDFFMKIPPSANSFDRCRTRCGTAGSAVDPCLSHTPRQGRLYYMASCDASLLRGRYQLQTVDISVPLPVGLNQLCGPRSSFLKTKVSFSDNQKSGRGLLVAMAFPKAVMAAFVPAAAPIGAASTPALRVMKFQSVQ